jgi:2,2-dialkylglycine decarboxylase (pyruvate)
MTTLTCEQQWLDVARDYCFRARLDTPHYDGPVFERGQGSQMWDVDGKAYLDFNAGQICGVLGHNHPHIVAAVGEACRTLMHSSSTYYNVAEIRLSEKLASILPAPLSKSFFSLSGSDATEAAINIARHVTGRLEVASPHISFHGLSDTPRSVSYAAWHKGIPPAVGSFALMAPYCLRCPISHTFPECDLACLSGSLEVLDAETVAPVAAIITEPIFSAGGVVEPPPGWLSAVRTACDERGSLLILDESQTGLGKLGAMWGFEREDVIPDIVVISKHFGGGVPISAVVTSTEVEEAAINAGFQYSHSHSADPLACTAALATLEAIEEEDLIEHARTLGIRWRSALGELAAAHEAVCDIRGRGVLQALEFEAPDGSPGYALGPLVTRACRQAGLLFSMRRRGSVLRFTIPLCTTDEQLDRAAAILDDSLRAAVVDVDWNSAPTGP